MDAEQKKQLLRKKLQQAGFKSNRWLSETPLDRVSSQQMQQVLLDPKAEGLASLLIWKFSLPATIEIKRLNSVFLQIIAKYPILSTIYSLQNNQLKPVRTDQLNWKVLTNGEYLDIHDPIDLQVEVPLKIRLVSTFEGIDLIIVLHHVACDEISWQILLSEITYFYHHHQELLVDKNIQSSLIQPLIADDIVATSNQFWVNKLQGYIKYERIDIFSVYRHQAKDIGYEANLLSIPIDKSILVRLKQQAKKNKISVISLLIASVGILFKNRGLNSWGIIGTAVDQRESSQSQQAIGNFISLLPLVLDYSGSVDLVAWAVNIHTQITESFRYRFFSVEQLVKVLQLNKQGQRNPLFDVIVLYRDTQRILELEGQKYIGEHIANRHCLFDIIFSVDEIDNRLFIEFKKNLLPVKIITALLQDWLRLLAEAFSDSVVKRSQLSTFLPLKIETTDIITKIQSLITENPEADAVEYLDHCLSRRELWCVVQNLVKVFQQERIQPGDIIAIAVDRCVVLPALLLATLYVGAVFLPIDIAQPSRRIKLFLTKIRPKLLISNCQNIFNLGEFDKSLYLDLETFTINKIYRLFTQSSDSLLPYQLVDSSAHLPAYIVFTSGTTGEPKAVMISRVGLNSVVSQMQEIFIPLQANSSTSYLALSTLGFDIAIFELVAPLFYGVKLLIGETHWSKNPLILGERFVQLKPTMVEATPSLWLEILKTNPQAVANVFACCGGETLPLRISDQLIQNGAEVYNLYGPTEMTIIATFGHCQSKKAPSIGLSLKTVFAVILDSCLQVVPDGFIGELYLFGPQIAIGYLYNSDLTAEHFVANPFVKGERMYRTGDLAYKEVHTGEIFYCGRLDKQLSLHGVRVEVEEIEQALATIEGVDNAVIKAVKNQQQWLIHAFYVGKVTEKLVKEQIKVVLPSYLQPLSINKINEIPVNYNGKIDRNALSEPIIVAANIRVPETEYEKVVAKIFTTILGVEEIMATDNFFMLGGYSLQIARLIHLLEQKTGVKLLTKDIFDHPTIEEIALLIEKKCFVTSTNESTKVSSVSSSDRVNDSVFELSNGQKRILTAELISPVGGLYNMPLVFKIFGHINLERLRKAFLLIFKRHPILTTVYDEVTFRGSILSWQEVEEKWERQFEVISCQNDVQLRMHLNEKIHTSFKLSQELPVKVVSCQQGQDNYLLILVHHIVADEWSLILLLKELQNCYTQLKKNTGSISEFYPVSCHYLHLIQKLNQFSEESEQFWSDVMLGFETMGVPLSSTHPIKKNTSNSISMLHQQIRLESDQVAKVRLLEQRYKVSPFHLMQASVINVLARFLNKDVCIGIPVHARNDIQFEEVIGYFSNTLPIRVNCTWNMTGEDLLLKVREITLQAISHSDFPSEMIYKGSQLPFSVLVDYRNGALPSFETDDFKAQAINWDVRLAKFPVIILYSIVDNQHVVDLLLSSDFYQSSNSVLFKQVLMKSIQFFLYDIHQNIASINYTDYINENNQLGYLSTPEKEFKFLPSMIMEALHKYADKMAISGMGYAMDYTSLLACIQYIAYQIKIYANNAQLVEQVYAVVAPNRLEQFILMLSVLYAGQSYVVLDLEYPLARREKIIDAVKPMVYLTTVDLNEEWECFDAKMIRLSIAEIIAMRTWHRHEPCRLPIHPLSLAYIVFTSGSTGDPKGVLISYRGLSDLLFCMQNLLPDEQVDLRMLSLAPMTFDVGLVEALAVLLRGGHLKFVEDCNRAGQGLLSEIKQHHVTNLSVTPSILETLGDPNLLPEHITIFIGAESISAQLFNKWSEKHVMVNLYGPTETTVNALTYSAPKLTCCSVVPIGLPDDGMSAVVLDEALQPVPIGVKGELYLGGTGLAIGYLNSMQETAVKFIASPFPELGSRLYRTGDLASINQDGVIISHGRVDEQFKIRGLRVEPVEIESALLSLEGVCSAWVGVHQSFQKSTLLAAITTKGNQDSLDITIEYREKLAKLLPQYLVPQTIISLPSLPITDNGKIDKKVIIDASVKIKESKRQQVVLANSSSDNALSLIQQTVSEVLGISIEEVNPQTTFLDLGGDSISALQVAGILKQQGMSVTPKDLLDANNFLQLAEAIILPQSSMTNVMGEEKAHSNQNEVPDSFRPIAILQEHLTDNSPDNLLAYCLLVKAPDDIEEKVVPIFSQLIERHTALRTQYINANEVITLAKNHPNLLPQIFVFKQGFDSLDFCKQQLGKHLSPFNGKNLAIGLIQNSSEYRLLIVIHHVAVDMVSCNIILSDLRKIYKKQSINSNSYSLKYCSKLINSSVQEDGLKTFDNITVTYNNRLFDKQFDPSKDISGVAGIKTLVLSKSNTEKIFSLLSILKYAIASEVTIEHLFLYILARAVGRIDFLGSKLVDIDWETHGRNRPEFLNTVGWFTSIKTIRCSIGGEFAENIRQIIQRSQIGITNHPIARHYQCRSDILFNYLGVLAVGNNLNNSRHNDYFEVIPIPEAISMLYSNNLPLRNPITVSASLIHQELAEQFKIEVIFSTRLLTTNKIKKFLQAVNTEIDYLTSLDIGTIQEQIVPVTYTQEGILQLYENKVPGMDAYVIKMKLFFTGQLDSNKLARAWRKVLTKHPMLSASFHRDNYHCYAKFHRSYDQFTFHNYQDENSEQTSFEDFLCAEEQINDKFILAEGSLCRIKMLSKNSQEHVLVIRLHHILADGWSSPIILKDLFAAYQDIQLTETANPGQLIEAIKTRPKEETRQQWQRYLRGAKPTVLVNGGLDKGTRQEMKWQLSPQLFSHLSSLCRKNRITLGSLLHVLWARILMDLTKQKKVSFGSVTSGRPSHIQGIDQVVGLFSNTVPLSVDAYDNDIIKLAREIGTMLMLATEEPLSLSELSAIPSHEKLFDSLLVLENYPLDFTQLSNPAEGIQLIKYEYEDGSHYPISMVINIHTTIQVRLLYADGVDFGFNPVRIKGIFNQQLECLINGLNQFREIKFDTNQLVVDQLRGIKLTGKTLGNCELLSLSSDETENYINIITRKLIKLGCCAEKRVILSLPKTIESTLLSIAIWKTGACLVPLDSEIDNKRYLQIKQSVDPHLVIDINSLKPLGLLIDFTSKVMNVPSFDLSERLIPVVAMNSCYIIYTSGTTGLPKGVRMQWSSIDNLIKWQISHLELSQDKTIAQFAPSYFDVSVQELLTAFSLGYAMVVVPEDIRSNSLELAQYLEDYKVDVLFATNLVINELSFIHEQKNIPKLEYLIQAGEKLEITKSLRAWLKHDFGPQLFNHYGPSETHVVAAYPVSDILSEQVPIGFAISNDQLLILDEWLKEVPQGHIGELYVLGESISTGYLGDTLGTSERFLAIPKGISGVKKGSRMYRTGDFAYQDSHGHYYCLGRSDEQIKIKGVRVEPREVIRALSAIRGVLTACVITNQEKNATALMAAVVLDEVLIRQKNISINEGIIKQMLSNLLPSYLLPDVVKIVGSIPVTSNNKLDVKKLRNQLLNQPSNSLMKEIRSSNFKLDLIKTTINGVLRSQKIIFDQDDFFAIGGHSLLATQLANQLNDLFGTNLSLKDIFESRTPLNLLLLINHQEYCSDNIQWIRPKGRLKASSAQKRFWILSKMLSVGHTYHLPLIVKLTAQQNHCNGLELFNLLKKTIVQLIAKHEALRTVLRSDDEGPYQHIWPVTEIESKLVAIYKVIDTKQLNRTIHTFVKKLFNFEKDLMLRMGLFQLSDCEKNKEYVLAITIHHLSCDAWSIPIILNDIYNIFEHLQLDPNYEDQQKVASYIDVIGHRSMYWERNSVLEKDLHYWKQQLQDLPYPMNLPLDFKRPVEASFKGRVEVFDFKTEVVQQIINFSRDNSVTPFMFLQACLVLLLHKMGCGEDIVVGTPDSGRQGISDSNVVGCFINLLVLRFNLSGNPTFMDLLLQVRRVSLEAYSHASTPFDVLVKAFSFSGIRNIHPLFTVGVGLQNYHDFDMHLSGFNVTKMDYQVGVARYDLNFDVVLDMVNPRLRLVVEYNTDLFKKKTIKTLLDRLSILVNFALAFRFSRLSDFSILLSHERNNFYRRISQRKAPIKISPRYLDIVHGAIPAEVSSIIADDIHTIEYRMLQYRVAMLAKKLIVVGIKPGDYVCIHCSRSISFFVSVLAVLRVGAAYVPVAEDTPSLRLGNILEQIQARVILGDLLADSNSAKNFDINRIIINRVGQLREDISIDNIQLPDVSKFSLDLAAYVIFTSGTTGTPKGVVVNRRSLAISLESTQRKVSFKSNCCYLAANGFGFDLAVFDVLWPLSNGLDIYILSQDQRLNPEQFKDILLGKSYTMTLSTPSFLSILTSVFDDRTEDKPLRGLMVLLAGEHLTQSLANKLLAFGAEVRPSYGPAETVIISNTGLYQGVGVPTLGDDFDSVQTLLLDKYLQPVPEGVCAELYIAGNQLADSYLNRAGLSAIRFIANPFYQGRLYRTGDFSVRRNGQLWFIGREDEQVSIRGHRVELSEIRSTILSIDGVLNAVVKVFHRGSSSILVGYVVLEDKSNLDEHLHDIRQMVSQHLPDYMVPQVIERIDTIPLTENGKIDYKQLPDPSGEWSGNEEIKTDTEQVIAQVLMDLLQISEPSRDTSFIALGLDSITVILFSNRLTKQGYSCSVQMIFKHQSISQLARALEETSCVIESDLRTEHAAKIPTFKGIKQDDLKLALEKWKNKRKVGVKKDE